MTGEGWSISTRSSDAGVHGWIGLSQGQKTGWAPLWGWWGWGIFLVLHQHVDRSYTICDKIPLGQVCGVWSGPFAFGQYFERCNKSRKLFRGRVQPMKDGIMEGPYDSSTVISVIIYWWSFWVKKKQTETRRKRRKTKKKKNPRATI